MNKNRITPSNIFVLGKDEIFVFGSNLAGRHGKGAALTAAKRFGAIYGRGLGLHGDCYAIPTKDENMRTLDLLSISIWVESFIYFAKYKKDKTFLVTEIGCGLAGYKPEDIAPLFKAAIKLDNIYLPKRFWNVL